METTQKMLALKQGKETIFVKQSDIVYCRIHKGLNTIYFEDGSKAFTWLATSHLYDMLDKNYFLSPHPAYIINKNHVAKVVIRGNNVYDIVLKDSTKIPLARIKKNEIIRLISENTVYGGFKTPQSRKRRKIAEDIQKPSEEEKPIQ